VQDEQAVSAAELAAMFDIPERLVAHWARTGRITTHRADRGRRVYLPSEVRRLLAAHR
jgi:DNA-binding transcriptional MerR regulator